MTAPAPAPACPVCDGPRDPDQKDCGNGYCGSYSRFCKNCGSPYSRLASGGGYKYCSPECRAIANTPGAPRVRPERVMRPVGEQPLCERCAKNPKHWVITSGVYSRYCGPSGCSNPTRECKHCKSEFTREHRGKSTYCSNECAVRAKRKLQVERGEKILCTMCKEHLGKVSYRAPGTTADYICARCREPFKHIHGRLDMHRVPVAMWERLLADPTCDICKMEIMEPRPDSSGRWRSPLTVDHDHACCPGSASCGKCVRGFLCAGCNTALGYMRDDPSRLRAAADYLDRQR